MSNEIKNKERKVFLENLPKRNNTEQIDWKNSIGYKIRFIYEDIEGEFEIVGYGIYREGYLTLKYENSVLNKDIHVGSFKNCNIGGLLSKITNEFKINIGENIRDENRDMVITNRKVINKNANSNKYYQYRCNKCGFDCGEHYKNGEYNQESWIVEGSILNGASCSCCCPAPRVVVPEINSIWATDRWMIDLGISEEDAKRHTKRSSRKINVTCPDCGKVKSMAIDTIRRRKSIHCSCGDGKSYPEKFISSILNQLKLDYQKEYSPKYLKLNNSQKRSDFYLEKVNIIIEADGKLGHIGGETHIKSNKTLEEHVVIDKWKDEQHALRGIKTIRINCFKSDMEYIRTNVLNSELAELYDLNNIDWLKCEEYALKNIVNEVCSCWNINNKNVSNLASIFKLSNVTIREYLKRGSKLGWCEYNPKEEMSKNAFKNGKKNEKKLQIFKNNVCVGEFNSVISLSKVSEELFDIKLLPSNISEACRTGKQYKGYTFHYITKEEYEQRKSQTA